MDIKRAHSPDYPAISLKEAIDRCRRLYQQIQAHPAPRQIVAHGLGFNSLHGGAMSAIAALRKYGLLNKQGETLRITDSAKRILFPKSDAEKGAAMEEAGLRPPLFAELYQHFGPALPSEMLITNHLIRAGFLANAAKVAIAAYNGTLPYIQGTTLVTSGDRDYDSNEEFEPNFEGGEETEMSVQQSQERHIQPSSKIHSGEASVPIVPIRGHERRLFDYDFEVDGGVGVVVRGSINTEEALDVLGAWIDLKRQELSRKATREAFQTTTKSRLSTIDPDETTSGSR